jgi:hypothetical protein
MALGTPPATLDYIRSIVGSEQRVDVGGHPRPVTRPTDDEPSPRELRRASSLVSRIILRLWAMEGLEAARSDEALVALAQPFLAQPFGMGAHLPVEKQAKPGPPPAGD